MKSPILVFAMTALVMACSGPSASGHFFDGADGDWGGGAETSPFGPIPYGFVLSHEANGSIVALAETPEGMGLPPGAYQRFVFTQKDGAEVMFFETSLTGDELVKGVMSLEPERSRAGELLVYCLQSGCEEMEVSFAMEQPGQILFLTKRGGQTHAIIHLQHMGE